MLWKKEHLCRIKFSQNSKILPTQERYIDSQLEHTDLLVLHGFVILNLFPIRNPLLCVESARGTPRGTL